MLPDLGPMITLLAILTITALISVPVALWFVVPALWEWLAPIIHAATAP